MTETYPLHDYNQYCIQKRISVNSMIPLHGQSIVVHCSCIALHDENQCSVSVLHPKPGSYLRNALLYMVQNFIANFALPQESQDVISKSEDKIIQSDYT